MQIYGKPVDDQTRCVHYATERDVVAIKFACCNRFFPCHLCHAETVDHAAALWPIETQDEHAILCGVCQQTMSITTYFDASVCPNCAAEFNDGCRLHRHLYFQ